MGTRRILWVEKAGIDIGRALHQSNSFTARTAISNSQRGIVLRTTMTTSADVVGLRLIHLKGMQDIVYQLLIVIVGD